MSAAIAAAHTTRKNLMNYLAAPARVASKMDWKRPTAGKTTSSSSSTTAAASSKVLAVEIGSDCIGLAVASHPSSKQPIRTLDPLRVTHETRKGTNRRVLSQDCVKSIASIVQEHEVCALLVSWPVQQEGRCGKPCGQVLHALDSLVEESNTIVTKTRPICLWDDRHIQSHYWDEFGRDPIFGRNQVPKNKTVYKASEEQYQHPQHACNSRSTIAAQVFQDFSNTHWPQMDHTAEERIIHHNNNNTAEENANDCDDDEEEEEEEQLKVAYA